MGVFDHGYTKQQFIDLKICDFLKSRISVHSCFVKTNLKFVKTNLKPNLELRKTFFVLPTGDLRAGLRVVTSAPPAPTHEKNRLLNFCVLFSTLAPRCLRFQPPGRRPTGAISKMRRRVGAGYWGQKLMATAVWPWVLSQSPSWTRRDRLKKNTRLNNYINYIE